MATRRGLVVLLALCAPGLLAVKCGDEGPEGPGTAVGGAAEGEGGGAGTQPAAEGGAPSAEGGDGNQGAGASEGGTPGTSPGAAGAESVAGAPSTSDVDSCGFATGPQGGPTLYGISGGNILAIYPAGEVDQLIAKVIQYDERTTPDLDRLLVFEPGTMVATNSFVWYRFPLDVQAGLLDVGESVGESLQEPVAITGPWPVLYLLTGQGGTQLRRLTFSPDPVDDSWHTLEEPVADASLPVGCVGLDFYDEPLEPGGAETATHKRIVAACYDVPTVFFISWGSGGPSTTLDDTITLPNERWVGSSGGYWITRLTPDQEEVPLGPGMRPTHNLWVDGVKRRKLRTCNNGNVNNAYVHDVAAPQMPANSIP